MVFVELTRYEYILQPNIGVNAVLCLSYAFPLLFFIHFILFASYGELYEVWNMHTCTLCLVISCKMVVSTTLQPSYNNNNNIDEDDDNSEKQDILPTFNTSIPYILVLYCVCYSTIYVNSIHTTTQQQTLAVENVIYNKQKKEKKKCSLWRQVHSNMYRQFM